LERRFFIKKEYYRMPTAKKEATIEELRRRLTSSKHLFFTDYAGLTVEEISQLRTGLRKDGNTYGVVKNTLFSIAAGKELAEKLAPFLAGPTAVVFAGEDPVAPAKALKTFSDDVKRIGVKAAYIDGRIVGADQVNALASLPPKTALQATLLRLLTSPTRGLVTVLSANRSGFVRVLDARAKQLAESLST
jgi:large subunit ribosomal protein L10